MSQRLRPEDDSKVLRKYLDDISRYAICTPERERELGRLIQNTETTEDARREAVDELVRGGSTHIALDIGRKSPATLRHIASLRGLFARERPDVVLLDISMPRGGGIGAVGRSRSWSAAQQHVGEIIERVGG